MLACGGMKNSSKTILVVEEKGDWGDLLIQVIERSGYEVIAVNKPEGIAEALPVHPDLIWLDLDLLRGVAENLLAQLHDDPSTTDIPVICEAACGDYYSVRRMLSAGAKEVLYKPFDLSDVPSILRNNLQPAA